MNIKILRVAALLGAGSILTASIVSAQTTSVTTPPATAQPPAVTQPQTTIQPQVITNREMVKQPIVNINPEGRILIHGMTVTSVGTNSFQGTVWGINYTVNMTMDNTPPMLLFRNGNEANAGIQLVKQLKVGDEVGVSGNVTAAAPLTIDGQIVRDYSISIPRQNTDEENGDTGRNMMGGKNNDEQENEGRGMMGNNGNVDQRAILLQLFQQVQALQKQFQEKFGTTPSTNPTGQ